MDNITIRQVNFDESEVLAEIYRQRVFCRQEKGYITFKKFPNGWCDELDKIANHFVAGNDVIVASGRITFWDNIGHHPYFNAVMDIFPFEFMQKPVAYISRDQVLPEFRGRGIQKQLFYERYKLCIEKTICNVLIDVPEEGYQLKYYEAQGYSNLGNIKIEKIQWDLGPSLLMLKVLNFKGA